MADLIRDLGGFNDFLFLTLPRENDEILSWVVFFRMGWFNSTTNY